MSITGTEDPQNNSMAIFDDVAETLIKELSVTKPKEALELGTGSGKSTAIIAQYSKNVTTIERIQKYQHIARSYLRNFKNINYILGYGNDNIYKKKYDFIFVDGPQGSNRRKTFLKMYPLTAKLGTMVIFDDAHRDDIKIMCETIKKQYGATYFISGRVAKLIQTCKLGQSSAAKE